MHKVSTSKDIIENDGTGVKYREALNFILMQALNAEKCFYDQGQLLTRQIKQSQKATRMRKSIGLQKIT